MSLEDIQKYSELQTRVIVLLEIENYLVKQRTELQQEMATIKALEK